MKTYQQSGNVLMVPSSVPVGSGHGVLVGAIFGVAVSDAEIGGDVAIKTTGVFELPKSGNQAWTVGARVYWDAGSMVCTTIAAGNYPIGAAVTAVGAGTAEIIGIVRLDGVATVAAA
jgi:predicted RecA/RadA family phage recombinase